MKMSPLAAAATSAVAFARASSSSPVPSSAPTTLRRTVVATQRRCLVAAVLDRSSHSSIGGVGVGGCGGGRGGGGGAKMMKHLRRPAFLPPNGRGCLRLRSYSSTSTRVKASPTDSSSETAVAAPSEFQLAPRLDGLDKPTVWHEFSPLAAECGAVNLGQGFPDWDPPHFVVRAMRRATDPEFGRDANQYARSAAHLPLAEVLAGEYTERIGRKIDPMTEVGTAVGCTQALYCALQGLLHPGDGVVLMEPAFDIYTSQVKLAGGIPRLIPLRSTQPESWSVAANIDEHDVGKGGGSHHDELPLPSANDVFTLDIGELETVVSDPTTKFLILNTPHNPTGKMFSRSELEDIADVVRRHPHVTVVTDEVYEHIVFDEVNSPHISFASLPGMFERTLTLSSSGKTFSATGWKIGWAVGPPHLARAVTSVQQWVNFSAPTPNQDAIALSLEEARKPYLSQDTFYEYLAGEYLRKRNLLIDALLSAGITPIVPEGGFFIMGDTSRVDFPYSRYLDEVTEAMPVRPMPRDWAMSRWMTREVGVTAIPPSAFYGPGGIHRAKDMLRFAFCKGDSTILEAHKRLKAYFSGRDGTSS